jgi:hypothetical protein
MTIVLLGSCGSAKRYNTQMYTYDVQYVDFRTDQVKDMGAVDAVGAVSAFRSFPFKEQLEKAKTLSEPTFPTISFRSGSDEAVLAVWSLEPDEYEIYLEQNEQKVTLAVRGEAAPIDAIQSFFNGGRADLYERLAKQPGAVTQRGIWNRLKSLCGGK